MHSVAGKGGVPEVSVNWVFAEIDGGQHRDGCDLLRRRHGDADDLDGSIFGGLRRASFRLRRAPRLHAVGAHVDDAVHVFSWSQCSLFSLQGHHSWLWGWNGVPLGHQYSCQPGCSRGTFSWYRTDAHAFASR